MFPLSTYAGLLESDIRAALSAAARLGLQGIVLDSQTGGVNLLDLSASGCRELRHGIASNRLQLVGLRATLPRDGLLGADPQKSMDAIRRSLETARNLETPLLLVDLQRLPNPVATDVPRLRATPEMAGGLLLPDQATIDAVATSNAAPSGDEREISLVDAAMRQIGGLADRIGVDLAFSASLSTMSALHRALSAAGCGHFWMDLDPVAVLGDAWTFEAVLDRTSNLTAHVRLRDAQLGADRRTVPATLGDGAVNLKRLMTLLREADFNGYCSIDVTHVQDRIRALHGAIRLLTALEN